MGTGGIHGVLDASIGGGGAERWESGLFRDRLGSCGSRPPHLKDGRGHASTRTRTVELLNRVDRTTPTRQAGTSTYGA